MPSTTRLVRASASLTIIILALVAGSAHYTVQRGDTLSEIAAEFGLTVGKLAELNDLHDINLIRAGQILDTGDEVVVDPAHDRHVVQRGETVAGIAARHGVTVDDIEQANGLIAGDVLLAGVSLWLLPTGTTFAPTIEPVVIHRASAGDHATDIAARHGIAASTVFSLNALDDDHITADRDLTLRTSWMCPVVNAPRFVNDWGVVKPDGRTHEGIDVFADRGTVIVAPVDGHVHQISSNRGGNAFVLVGDDGWTYYGAHMDSAGQSGTVKAGTPIGTVGDSGNAVGSPPHLHIEVWKAGEQPQNPYPTLRAACGR